MFIYALILAIFQVMAAVFILGKMSNEGSDTFFEVLVTLLAVLGIQAPIFGRVLGFW